MYVMAIFGGFSSCQRSGCDVWEDTKSSGRHFNRGLQSLNGKCGDSRAVCDPSQFECQDEDIRWARAQAKNYEFTPLSDMSRGEELAMAEFMAQQPSQTPGDPGSNIPGIESFRDPSQSYETAGIFKNVEFDFDNYQIRGDQNSRTIAAISNYMRNHPNTYLFIEGHCDQRGPEAYNLSLGAKRANAVRNELVQMGVNPDNLFTISYGKERPLINENNEYAWSRNRRSEFKVYQN
ncbi:MAG: OmpA family protein [Chlamydiia bacterium]|nr:OmpA family protein [Chlamydiia bacterium]